MNKTRYKIWIDIEEPKTGIMFKSLITKFQENGIELLITARDFDSTYQILDDLNIQFYGVGDHGGDKLENKLEAYIKRLAELFPIVKKQCPDYFITFSSVEGPRISYGLKIPSIGYNDEPRNIPVCKLIFPFLDKIITPECVPKEWYLNLHADEDKLIRYNGIDEIAWLSEYEPNADILDQHDLEKGKFVIIRSEPTVASYFIEKLRPEESMIHEFFPQIFNEYPDYKYILIARTEEQKLFLERKIKDPLNEKNLLITRYMPNIVDLCFFSSLVISGGGTIVRESSLLNVPSIEFFPGETAPQEHFLINHGFPLDHIKKPVEIAKKAINVLSEGIRPKRFDHSFKEKINQFENPNDLCFNEVMKKLNS